MQPHVKNYFAHFGYSKGDTILCEVCRSVAVDIHHIEPRSKFGSKTKHLRDHVSNLIALCRICHDKAHANLISKEELKQLR